MAVPVIATQTTFADAGNATSRSINKPASTAAGDWLVFICSMDGAGAVSINGSFTERFQLNGVTNTLAVFTRKADGSEGASFTVTTSSETGCGVMMRITGGDSTDVVDVISNFHGFAGINGEIEAPLLYSESADTLLIHACGADNGTTALTKPTADTAVVTNLSSGGLTAGAQLTVSSLSQASAGYTAHSHFATSLTSEEHISFTIALRSTSTPDTYPAQPVIRTVSMRAPQSAETMNVQKPYGTVDDDLLLVFAHSDVTGTLTPPGTFTSIQNTSNTAIWAQAYRRIASSEGASYDWSNTTLASKSATMLRVVNVDTAAAINTSSVNTGTDATMDASTITPSVDNCLLLFCGAADDDDVTFNSGFPTGYTNILTLGISQGGDSTHMFAFKTQTTAAATGTITGSLDASEEWIAFNIAVAPSAADPVETISETATVTDSYTVSRSSSLTQTETTTPSDASAVTRSASVTLSETQTETDSYVSTLAYTNTLTESVTPSDAQSITSTGVGLLSETGTVTDANATTRSASVTLSESQTETDSYTASPVFSNTLTETQTPSDSLATIVTGRPAVSETNTPSDNLGGRTVLSDGITETCTPTDANSGRATGNVTLSESASLTDAYDSAQSGGAVYNDSFTETLNATDSYTITATQAGEVAETVAANDNYDSSSSNQQTPSTNIPGPSDGAWDSYLRWLKKKKKRQLKKKAKEEGIPEALAEAIVEKASLAVIALQPQIRPVFVPDMEAARNAAQKTILAIYDQMWERMVREALARLEEDEDDEFLML